MQLNSLLIGTVSLHEYTHHCNIFYLFIISMCYSVSTRPLKGISEDVLSSKDELGLTPWRDVVWCNSKPVCFLQAPGMGISEDVLSSKDKQGLTPWRDVEVLMHPCPV